jgi:hypothetical protein
MQLLRILLDRRYRRRYHAAIAIYLAVDTYQQLDPATQAAVDKKVNELCLWADYSLPSPAMQRVAHWDLLASARAMAMAHLGIPPDVPGLAWTRLFHPFAFGGQRFLMDFRPMDKATLDAKAFLRSKGLNVPDRDPYSEGDLAPLDGSIEFFRAAGLDKHWRNEI